MCLYQFMPVNSCIQHFVLSPCAKKGNSEFGLGLGWKVRRCEEGKVAASRRDNRLQQRRDK